MSVLLSQGNLEELCHESKDFLQRLAYIPENFVELDDLGGLIPSEPTDESNTITRYYINAQEISEIIEKVLNYD